MGSNQPADRPKDRRTDSCGGYSVSYNLYRGPTDTRIDRQVDSTFYFQSHINNEIACRNSHIRTKKNRQDKENI